MKEFKKCVFKDCTNGQSKKNKLGYCERHHGETQKSRDQEWTTRQQQKILDWREEQRQIKKEKKEISPKDYKIYDSRGVEALPLSSVDLKVEEFGRMIEKEFNGRLMIK